jgi:hypothetical protein
MSIDHGTAPTLRLLPVASTTPAAYHSCCSPVTAARVTTEPDTCCATAAPTATVTAEHDDSCAPATESSVTAEPDTCCSASTSARPDADWLTAARYTRVLAWASLAWMTLEGVIGLVAGFSDTSIALVGWALGSVFEGLASVIVIWRFTGGRTLSEDAERRAQRMVAVSFFLLAPYVAAEAVHGLVIGQVAHPSVVAMVLTASSVGLMPLLGVAKHRLGTRLASGATAAEGTQNLMCAAQGAAVLVGLTVTATLGWHWIDPAVALALAVWAVREGIQAWHGKDCC